MEIKMNRYQVISWDTGEILFVFDTLNSAKRKAKSLGHTGEDNPILTGYPPIAYVSNEFGEVVYNPRFKKQPACNHPPARLFSWYAGDTLCVGCCKCGTVLKGGAE